MEGIEHIEYLPIMDYKNKSIKLEQVTSFDVNKAIQRSLTKAAARHGIGLYIYAGEDLPERDPGFCCEICGKPFKETTDKNGRVWTPEEIYMQTKLKSPTRKASCKECSEKQQKEGVKHE